MKRKRSPAETRNFSRLVVDGIKQTPARAMLHAVGFGDDDFAKPQVGIASTWSNLTPCNMHIDELARLAAPGVEAQGAKAVTFSTITVSDGISMGTPGMRYSLVSREVIADSIETVVGAQGFDGVVAFGGCDKNMPGCLMALARLDRPAVFVYGGTIRPGTDKRDIVSVFEAVGGLCRGHGLGSGTQVRRTNGDSGTGLLRRHVHGEHHGLGHRGARNEPAEQLRARGRLEPKARGLRRAPGAAVVELIKRGIRPRHIMTRKAFENAITVSIALGGSTNAVLHLLAIASSANVKLQAR